MPRLVIGLDNGSTGSVAVLNIRDRHRVHFFKTPVVYQQDYTKTKKGITRLDSSTFLRILKKYAKRSEGNLILIIERPVTGKFKKSIVPGMRFLEAVLVCAELSCVPYRFIDSKEWQKELLPKGVKKEQLKKASLSIGVRLFPKFKDLIKLHKDADSLLIAEYARLKKW